MKPIKDINALIDAANASVIFREALESIDAMMFNYPESTGQECAEIARKALEKAMKK